MPNWLTKIFAGGVGEAVAKITAVIDDAHMSKNEKALAVEKIMLERDSMAHNEVVATLAAKERILVAELQQGSTYTKAARPTIVYTGLVAAVLQGIEAVPFVMPPDFWYVWAGVCGVYMVGRTAEKMRSNGVMGSAASVITGGPKSSLLA